jgi:hypothetical protein
MVLQSVRLENFSCLSNWKIFHICLIGKFLMSLRLENISWLSDWKISHVCQNESFSKSTVLNHSPVVQSVRFSSFKICQIDSFSSSTVCQIEKFLSDWILLQYVKPANSQVYQIGSDIRLLLDFQFRPHLGWLNWTFGLARLLLQKVSRSVNKSFFSWIIANLMQRIWTFQCQR